MSWVTVDRLCEQERLVDEEVRSLLEANNRPLRSSAGHLSDAELLDKLRGFGLDLDRRSLEKLCASALSAEEVARPPIASRGFRGASEHIQGDWIWICVVSLWQRWWPDRVCLELVDDKVQAGYGEFEHDQNACAAVWLEAWSDVLRLCDATGIRSIEAFDERFPMTQSLYNWSQDLEDVLWNAGLSDREMLRARIAVCAEALRRFPAEDQQMTENRRRALAESYFELGETGKAEELFESWLADDPRWGFGWIGWAGCYVPDARRPNDYSRAEELLSRGYATPDVRDRAVIADWLQVLCEDTGRQREAEEFARQAEKLRRQPPRVSVSPRLKLAEEHEETSANAPARPTRTVKVGRNAPCPCGSGKKYKKCCGSPNAGDRAADA